MFPSNPFAGGPPAAAAGVSPVNPSVVNNFPSFSNITGGMQDSGVGAASFSNRVSPSVNNNFPSFSNITGTLQDSGVGAASFSNRVSPSVNNNFPSFSGITGTFQDSGVGAASFVILVPTTSARNTIQPSGAAIVPLTISGFAAQLANLFEAQTSAAVLVASISPAGLGTFVGGVTTAKTTIVGTADVIQLSVTPNATQTNPTIKFLTSNAGKDWQWSKTGGILHKPVDDAAVPAEIMYNAIKTYTGAGGTALASGAIQSNVTFNPSANGSSPKMSGIGGVVTKFGTSNLTGTTGWLAGVFGQASVSSSVNAGTVLRLVGVLAQVFNDGVGGTITHSIGVLSSLTGAASVTSTNMYGVVVATSLSLGINTLITTPTNLYGLYVEDISVGVTLNYAIFTNAGLVHFGDSLDMASGKSITMLAGNIITDTTTGTKIGTAVGQRLGFWNATPITQPAEAAQAAPSAYATGVFGLDSDANMHALYNLVVAMRTALVNSGIMKGSA